MRYIAIIVFLASGIWCSGQTAAEVRAELQRQGVPHPEIVLAQARLETGNFTSRLCKSHHNIFKYADALIEELKKEEKKK